MPEHTMLQKSAFFFLWLCLFPSFFSAQSLGSFFSVAEEDAAFVDDSGNPSCRKMPDSHGHSGTPLRVTEYKGPSFDSLAPVKTRTYREGKPEAEQVFGADGAVVSALQYVYNDAGLLAEIRGADAAGVLKWAYRFVYDEQSRLEQEISVSVADGQESVESSILSFYDSSSRLVKRETFSAEGAVTLRETFIYNENGKLAEKNSYYGDETLLKRTVYEYAVPEEETARASSAPSGAVYRIRHYDSNGLYETVALEYQDGRVSSVFRYGADGVLKDREARVYAEGKPLRMLTVNADGNVASGSFCLYDWMGNPVLERDSAGITVWEFAYPG